MPLNFRSGPAEYRALPSYFCNPLQRYYWPITRPETIIPLRGRGRRAVTHTEPQNVTLAFVVVAFALGVIVGRAIRDPPSDG